MLLATLAACSPAKHPIDQQLSQLRPVTIAALTGLDWPAGSLLCPLTPYQDSLPPGGGADGERVNAFLKRKQFKGEDGQWSLVIVKPSPAGDAGIEQLLFKQGGYDVINEGTLLKRAETVPANFRRQICVPVEHARVLVTRTPSDPRPMISFGTAD